MKFSQMKIDDFLSQLASSAPVPGGGGVSALVAALGIGLGDMVACLTIGKKKYADYEQDLIEIKSRAERLERELLDLIQADADVFEPLSKAYKVGPGEVMEEALKEASRVPLKIIEKCGEVIDLHADLLIKGSKLLLSDVGAGVILSKAAMQAASLSVYINTSSMQDKDYAEATNARAESFLEKYQPLADEIFAKVRSSY